MTPTILLVDAPPHLVRALTGAELRLVPAASANEAHARIAEVAPELVLVAFPRAGVELLSSLRVRWPELVCVAHLSESVGLAGTAEALRAGAIDVISGAAPREELLARIEKALEVAALRRSRRCLRELEARDRGAALVGQSPALQQIRARICAAAAGDGPVLITGETGTGKELVARELHRWSARREAPLRIVSCTAASHAFEEELFGRERERGGAGRRGVLEAAAGGTLVLDEVGELELGLQGQILRALDGPRSERDARWLATSSRDLTRLAAAGQLRADLLQRIAETTIHLPPLRQRREDIPLLAGHFIAQLGVTLGVELGRLDPRAEALLLSHPLPGNVRQLRNLIEQAAHRARGGTITAELIDTQPAATEGPLGDELERVQRRGAELLVEEERLVRTALRRVDGNKTRAAALLRISRYALQRKLRRFSSAQ